MNSKLFFLLILAMILLILVGLGLGWTHNARAAAPKWMETLQTIVAPRHPLTSSDLLFVHPEDCRALLENRRLKFPPGSRCIFYIQAADAPVRTLEMAVEEGVIRVDFSPQEPDRLAVYKTLTPQKPHLRLAVFQQGGKLTLTCLPDHQCILTQQ